ncbi:MAG: NTP transferase domain-containing protein [Lachnospiraceae bacterium]|nr:NTP transferase domain-containing protein [Lachnospiraceae bacterium]
MKAIILAAGQGTRLKKYTENLPKGMLSFMDRTIIERQIALYRAAGIDRIIIVRGYAADKIAYEGVTYYDNEDYANTNMVISLLAAAPEFDDDVIVSYSDILFVKGC